LPLPNLIGPHQVSNAGAAVVAQRALVQPEESWEASVTNAHWPGRMQQLVRGPIINAVPGAEVWRDGGHNAAAGRAIAAHFATLSKRPTYIIAGMLSTKDPMEFFRPLAPIIAGLCTVSIPGENASFSAGELSLAAGAAGIDAEAGSSVMDCVSIIKAKEPNARIVICGSLYLAGRVLRDNG
jgi:dihydrofolate synthase/folylpolyglutamate synthase